MRKEVIVYTKLSCVHCQRMKVWMNDNKIEFIEMDLSDINNSSLLQKIEGVPYTVVKQEDGTENIVLGFNQNALRELLL